MNTELMIKLIIISELADVSNFCDYIATKLIVDYPTIHDSKNMSG